MFFVRFRPSLFYVSRRCLFLSRGSSPVRPRFRGFSLYRLLPLFLAVFVSCASEKPEKKKTGLSAPASDPSVPLVHENDYTAYLEQHPFPAVLTAPSPNPQDLFYTALIYRRMNRPEKAAEILTYVLRNGESLWALYSALFLREKLDYPVDDLIKIASARPGIATWASAYKLGLLFFDQKKYTAAYPYFKVIPSREEFRRSRDFYRVYFSRAASALLGRIPGWEKEVRFFFFDIPSNSYHRKLYNLLYAEPGRQKRFSLTERTVFRAKAFAGEREYGKAYREFFPAVTRKSARTILQNHPNLFYDLRPVISVSGYRKTRAPYFLEKASSFRGEARQASLFLAARLFQTRSSYRKSLRLYENILSTEESSPELREKALFFLLFAELSYAPGSLPRSFEEYREQVRLNPSYFDDFFESYGRSLILNRRWSTLRDFNAKFSSLLTYPVRLHYAWLDFLGAVYDTGISAKQREKAVKTNLEILEQDNDITFYTVLSHFLQNRNLDFISLFPESPPATPPARLRDYDRFALGFLNFDLKEDGFPVILSISDKLNDGTVRTIARWLNNEKKHYEAIRLMGPLRRRENFRLTRQDIEILYPSPYQSLIRRYTGKTNVSSSVIYGIIRQESAFKEQIQSHVGAQGLMQLMPSTALEQARKLKLKSDQYYLPEINIRLGASYIDWLISRPWTDNLSEALMAYNAGGGNVRKWKRRYPSRQTGLFLESIDYSETRKYVKKVLKGALTYDFLYGPKKTEEIFRQFFPDFSVLENMVGKKS